MRNNNNNNNNKIKYFEASIDSFILVLIDVSSKVTLKFFMDGNW